MLVRVILAFRSQAPSKRLQRLLRNDDVLLEHVRTRDEMWERAVGQGCDVVLAGRDVITEPRPDRIRLLGELPDPPVVVVLSKGAAAEQARAGFVAAGYEAVLSLELSDARLRAAITTILEKKREQSRRLLAVEPRRMARPSLSDFVSHSRAMQTFARLARRVVRGDSSLLILGETGVGKERLARAIHAEGGRSAGPFIAVNCGALPETLLDSELFGHERGAFTGAERGHRGCFELAHRGVIFLDEIAEMPSHLQVKLLRVVQEREVLRIGSEQPFTIDVRIMAATNRDPMAEVEAGRLRRDLLYRLNVVTLTIPPLRERCEDIPDLVRSHLDYLRPRVGRAVRNVSERAMAALQAYDWPGNVRELMNVIERAMLLCPDDVIDLPDLPQAMREQGVAPPTGTQREPGPLDGLLPEDWLARPLREVRELAVEGLERAYLVHHLRDSSGRVGETALRAGIEPRSLFDKMRRYGLRKEMFRPSQSRRPPR